MSTQRQRFGKTILIGLSVTGALLLVGCTPAVEAEGEQGPIHAKATLVESFDGRCGFGLDVQNTGSEPVHFPQGDWESVAGASMLEWHVPFGRNSAPEGFALTTKLPPTIEAGESARIAFVTNCDGEPVVISVNPTGLGPVVLKPFE
ncbi:hypothetical protein ET445_12590 [Agromyces protaetiae]|uniref:DUF4232 domain-containing protein n=1 Tax=Agromyces protaetiae TaxID=2509455 RepID=A0A4V0YHA7_9MICO|nr:hypothetical protein [Agromyces protaetiae]QAY74051.1 hypothetical protein ET445_12590 [Agromyces protaetiae]